MKKSILLCLCFTLRLWSMEEVDEETALMQGLSVEDILQVKDPVKFAYLTHQLTKKPTTRIAVRSLDITDEQLLLNLKESIENLNKLNNGITKELETLGQQAVSRWNPERKKGIGYTATWALTAVGSLASAGYTLYSDLNTESKIATGGPLVLAALASIKKFLNHANQVINNTHINTHLDNQRQKSQTIDETKKNLEKEIKRLEKKISAEQTNKKIKKGKKKRKERLIINEQHGDTKKHPEIEVEEEE